MRRLVRLALITSIIASINCGSATSPTGTGSPGSGSTNAQGTMSATIANIPWTANGSVTATYSPAQNNLGVSVLNLVGQDAPLTQTLVFAVGSPTVGTALTPGIYQVGTATGTNALLTVTTGVITTYQASGPVGNGTVTINTFSTATRRASGTFNFVVIQSGASAQKAIAGGAFDVTF
jgi:hypothetical protein